MCTTFKYFVVHGETSRMESKNLSYTTVTATDAMSFWQMHIVSEAHTLGYLYGLGFSVLSRKRRVTIRLRRQSGRLGCFAPPTVVTANNMAEGEKVSPSLL